MIQLAVLLLVEDGLIDGKVGNDWIEDHEIQEQICLMIDNILEYLENLL